MVVVVTAVLMVAGTVHFPPSERGTAIRAGSSLISKQHPDAPGLSMCSQVRPPLVQLLWNFYKHDDKGKLSPPEAPPEAMDGV